MRSKRLNIAAIIVTYNRSALLYNCISAIRAQTYQPGAIYVIDNASTDDTQNIVKSFPDDRIRYVRLDDNIGGAGGFYTGMKLAHSTKEFDAVWVMDDDGQPSQDCLACLIPYLEIHDYISPVVVDIESRKYLSFPAFGCNTLEDLRNKYKDAVPNHSNPFNGILFSSRLMDKIGYPKKEMFIWGDEEEYDIRAKTSGLRPIMVLDAVHFHPKDKQPKYNDFLGRPTILWPANRLRQYCLLRNRAYRFHKYYNKKPLLELAIIYSWYSIFKLHSLRVIKLVYSAIRDGIRGDFSHLNEYK